MVGALSVCVKVVKVLLLTMLPTETTSRTRFHGLSGACALHTSNDRRVQIRGRLALFARTTVGNLCKRAFVICGPSFRGLRVRTSCAHRGSNAIIRAPTGTFMRMLPTTTTGTPTCGRLGRVIIIRAKLRLNTAVILSCSVMDGTNCLPRLSIYYPIGRLSPVGRFAFHLGMPTKGSMRCRLLGTSTRPSVTRESKVGSFA